MSKEMPFEREKHLRYKKSRFERKRRQKLSETEQERAVKKMPITIMLPEPLVATLEEYAIRGIPTLSFDQLVEQSIIEMIRSHRGLTYVYKQCATSFLTRFGDETGINISELAKTNVRLFDDELEPIEENKKDAN